MLTRETLQLGPTIYGAPEMRYYDGAANDEADRERFEQFGACRALLGAAREMIRHAVVAAKDKRCNETEQLFGFDVERAGFVGARVEREKSIDDEISLAQDLSIHSLAKLAKLFERTWISVLMRCRRRTAVRLRRPRDGSRAL